VVGSGVVTVEMLLAEPGVTSMLTGIDRGPHGVAHSSRRTRRHTRAQSGTWRRPGRTAAVGAVCGNTGLVDPGAGAGPTMEVAGTVAVADLDERLDLGPEEGRIAFRNVGGIFVAKTLVHPDLGELMKQCIELPESVREAFARVMIAI
jgi:hypothetical protein